MKTDNQEIEKLIALIWLRGVADGKNVSDGDCANSARIILGMIDKQKSTRRFGISVFITPFVTRGISFFDLILYEPWGNLRPALKTRRDGARFKSLFFGLWVRCPGKYTSNDGITLCAERPQRD